MSKMRIQSGKIRLLTEDGSPYGDHKKIWTMLGIPQTLELTKLVSEDVLVYLDFLADIPLVFMGHKKMEDSIKEIQSKREAQAKKWDEWSEKDITKDFVHTFGNYYTTNINDGFGVLISDYDELVKNGKLIGLTKQVAECITELIKPNPDGFVSYIGSILKKYYKGKLNFQFLTALTGGTFDLFNQLLSADKLSIPMSTPSITGTLPLCGTGSINPINFNARIVDPSSAKSIFLTSWEKIFKPKLKRIDFSLI